MILDDFLLELKRYKKEKSGESSSSTPSDSPLDEEGEEPSKHDKILAVAIRQLDVHGELPPSTRGEVNKIRDHQDTSFSKQNGQTEDKA